MAKPDLIRFLDAQDQIYTQVVEELTNGRKQDTGTRASELRGPQWADVDLMKRKRQIRSPVGRPQWHHGPAEICCRDSDHPIGDMAVITLREWRMQCPKGEEDLVFPTSSGTVEYHQNLMQRVLWPSLEVAGLGRKYGLHSLRHFYASWCINRREDGGWNCPQKSYSADRPCEHRHDTGRANMTGRS